MICAFAVLAQSKTTEDLQKNNTEAMSLFFYHNTLRMMNQDDDPEFDELIKDIEKLKFIMLDKKKTAGMDYKKLVKSYKAESFEEIMTSRFEGKNFDVFLKESGGKTKGMVVTINDAENLFVLDIVGSIALNKITSFYKKLDESTELGKKIKDFTEKSK
jgi:tRNA(Leu) C34 or U34 (ribose-2'-O)-methylase TrmL